jgi:hypothetical protein
LVLIYPGDFLIPVDAMHVAFVQKEEQAVCQWEAIDFTEKMVGKNGVLRQLLVIYANRSPRPYFL